MTAQIVSQVSRGSRKSLNTVTSTDYTGTSVSNKIAQMIANNPKSIISKNSKFSSYMNNLSRPG